MHGMCLENARKLQVVTEVWPTPWRTDETDSWNWRPCHSDQQILDGRSTDCDKQSWSTESDEEKTYYQHRNKHADGS